MKKLVIAAAAVAMAMGVQAAQFKWTTSTAVAGVTPSAVIDNGTYDASTTSFLGGNNSNFKYELLMYTQGHRGEADYLVGSASGDAKLGSTGKGSTTGINIADASSGVTYDYIFKLTVVQTDLAKKPETVVDDMKYNYSGASLSYQMDGTVTAKTSAQGVGNLPGSWTVSGITAEAVPEPTSGLLLLLGVAGLALRRRRA